MHCSERDRVVCLSEWHTDVQLALVVPVLRKRFSADTPVDVADSFWAVESWIAPPFSSDVPLNRWTKNIKITETHALFYFSLKSTVTTASGHADQTRIYQQEAIADVLYMRLQGGEAVNVEEEDAHEMLQTWRSLL